MFLDYIRDLSKKQGYSALCVRQHSILEHPTSGVTVYKKCTFIFFKSLNLHSPRSIYFIFSSITNEYSMTSHKDFTKALFTFEMSYGYTTPGGNVILRPYEKCVPPCADLH